MYHLRFAPPLHHRQPAVLDADGSVAYSEGLHPVSATLSALYVAR